VIVREGFEFESPIEKSCSNAPPPQDVGAEVTLPNRLRKKYPIALE